MADVNPYAAPRSQVDDVQAGGTGNFVAGGRAVPAGNGWQWIADGWGLFIKQPVMWIGILLVWGIIFIALSLVPFLGMLATYLLFCVFGAGFLIGCRALEGGGELEFSHLFAGFRHNSGNLIVVGVLYMAGSLVAAIPSIALMGTAFFKIFAGAGGNPAAMLGMSLGTLAIAWLLWMALLVPVIMAVWFAPALVALHDMTPVDALKASFGACMKNMMPFLIYGIVGVALFFIAAIPFLLGFLVLGPVLIASIYTSYRDIFFTDN